jgi:uncharacterized protein (TIGR01244 family)
MFRPLTPQLSVAPQIGVADVAEAARQGFTFIVNNRPDGEEPSEPQGDEIAAAAQALGIGYVAIPVTHAGFSLPQVESMLAAISAPDAKILAYCRSGTRSTLLWALARSAAGDDADDLTRAAQAAGYDLSGIRPIMDQLRAQRG